MRLFCDDTAIRSLRQTGMTYYEDRRSYYISKPELQFFLVLRNGLDPLKILNRVVDANVGWEIGVTGFVYPDHVGRLCSKVTVYRLLTGMHYDYTLSQIMGKAPVRGKGGNDCGCQSPFRSAKVRSGRPGQS